MAVEAYGEWRRGRLNEALSLLEDERTQIIWFAQVWLAQLYTQLGRFQDAERAYRAYTITPMQFEYLDPLYRRRLGAVYEALGEYHKAQRAYEYFLEYWSYADPELQPMVQETRQALVRLQECCTN